MCFFEFLFRSFSMALDRPLPPPPRRLPYLFLGNGGEGDGVLVVLAQVEVPRKPRLDAAVLADLRGEMRMCGKFIFEIELGFGDFTTHGKKTKAIAKKGDAWIQC